MPPDFRGLVRTRGRDIMTNSKMERRGRTSTLPKYFADLSLLDIKSYCIHYVPLRVVIQHMKETLKRLKIGPSNIATFESFNRNNTTS